MKAITQLTHKLHPRDALSSRKTICRTRSLSSSPSDLLQAYEEARKSKDTIPLVFMRAAQSTWNKDNCFIGWADTPLTREGVLEARVAGKLMKESGLDFDEAHCSVLRRATKTVWLTLQELDLEWIHVYKDWRLNEQQYGALVGKNRKQVTQEFGAERVKRWRRSWDENEKPPPIRNMNLYPGNGEIVIIDLHFHYWSFFRRSLQDDGSVEGGHPSHRIAA